MVDGVRAGRSKREQVKKSPRRGRLAAEEWQLRARYVLRHLEDPIALQRSPLCRLAALERQAKAKYPNGIVARGRALNDLALQCLQEIEGELDGHTGVAKLKAFVLLTRQGMGPAKASRTLGITPAYASRTFKRNLVELLAEKLAVKLR